MPAITTSQLKEFLDDFIERSETIVLEEGAEKNEIFEVAKAHGILLKDSNDLAGFKTIYAFTDKANANGAVLPKKELLKALPTMVGKPIDIDHNRKYVVGYYIDYKYIHKTGTIIAYGIFFKSNFAEEWEEAKRLFKEKKLATSFEIWSPKNKRKVRNDGTYELYDMEIAGGALIYKEQPAFKDAKVLEIAKKKIEEGCFEKELIKASKQYNEEELICLAKITNINITCQNCNKTFEVVADKENYKCPYCECVVNKNGEVIALKTEGELRVACPNCSGKEWAVIEEGEDFTELKCLNCGENYKIVYEKLENRTKHLSLLLTGRTNCAVCGKEIKVSFLSKQDKVTVVCPSCSVKYEIEIKKVENKRKIKKIEKANLEGGKDMDGKLIVTKFHRYFEGEDFEKLENQVHSQIEGNELEEAKKLSYQERKKLPDDVFAVIITVKNKKTGEPRKIRMFPIHDEEHVRNALARLAQKKVRQTLKAYKISVDKVLKKVLKKAKELKMYSLLLRHEEDCKRLGISIPKIVEKASVDSKRARLLNKYKELRKKYNELVKASKETEDKLAELQKKYEEDMKKLQEEFENKVKEEIEKSKKIAERRQELGEFAKDLSDEQLLDDKEFEIAKLKKKVAELETANKKTASPVIGQPSIDDRIAEIRKRIDKKAFGR